MTLSGKPSDLPQPRISPLYRQPVLGYTKLILVHSQKVIA